MPEIDYQHIGGYGPESLPGHSGSETSEAAARRPGIGPKTMEVHELVHQSWRDGVTCAEVEQMSHLGHGAASASLTRLHRAEYIVRLTEKRSGQQVYVIPEHVNGREESPYRPNAAYRPRPVPTRESVIEDLMAHSPGRPPIAHTEPFAEWMAERVLQIVEKYR